MGVPPQDRYRRTCRRALGSDGIGYFELCAAGGGVRSARCWRAETDPADPLLASSCQPRLFRFAYHDVAEHHLAGLWRPVWVEGSPEVERFIQHIRDFPRPMRAEAPARRR